MYYNPNTQEKLSYTKLKKRLNTSFPDGEEFINGWYLVYDSYPQLSSTQYAIESIIEKIDEKYIQTYMIEDLPDNINKQDEIKDISRQERIVLLEKAICELSQLISNLEEDRIQKEKQKEEIIKDIGDEEQSELFIKDEHNNFIRINSVE